MIKYYWALALCFLVNEVYDLRAMNPATQEDKATVLKHYCGYCYKQEVTNSFKLCQKCKIIRYCGPDCQRADWPVHKTKCPDIDLEKERKAIALVRDSILEFLKTLLPDKQGIGYYKLERTAAEEEAMLHEINTHGVLVYEAIIREECIAAQKKKDSAGVKKCMNDLLFATLNKERTNPYLLVLQESLTFPSQKRVTQVLGCGKEDTQNMFTLFKDTLEVTKMCGTRSLNKGYSAIIETTLESLRMIIVKTWALAVKAQEKRQENIFTKALLTELNTLVFVYDTLCDIPCLLKDKEEGFIKAVNNKDCTFLLTCLAWDKIIEKKLENPSFLTLEGKQAITLADACRYVELWRSRHMMMTQDQAAILSFITVKSQDFPLHCLYLMKQAVGC
jgi:hypothetical protein